MPDYDTIKFEINDDDIARLRLNRPEQRNAFNALMIEELTAVFDDLAPNPVARLLVLSRDGKSFSAGADLQWMTKSSIFCQEEYERDAVALAEMLRKLAELPMLTLGIVHGAAMGGGAGLVAACDVVVARADTKFSFSEVRLGLSAATISPYVMSAVGPRWAKALFMTGETFNGIYAERMGLVHYTVETDEDMTGMEEYLTSLVFSSAPGAIADSKRLVLDLADRELGSALSVETAKRIAARRTSEEGREGISAFLEKRKPNWVK